MPVINDPDNQRTIDTDTGVYLKLIDIDYLRATALFHIYDGQTAFAFSTITHYKSYRNPTIETYYVNDFMSFNAAGEVIYRKYGEPLKAQLVSDYQNFKPHIDRLLKGYWEDYRTRPNERITHVDFSKVEKNFGVGGTS